MAEDCGNFEKNRLLALLSIFEVTKCLMLKETIDEKTLNLLKLCEQVVEFLVVVLLDTLNFFAHGAEFSDLVFHFILELRHFTL